MKSKVLKIRPKTKNKSTNTQGINILMKTASFNQKNNYLADNSFS